MTALDRLLRAGIAEHVARRHFRYGRVHVAGTSTTDPATPAAPPTTVVLRIGQDLPIPPEGDSPCSAS